MEELRTISIHEALAELNLIDKKIASKKSFLLQRLVHEEPTNYAWIDEFADKGGVQKVIAQELQAIKDLLANRITIRKAINAANMANTITVGDTEKTIQEWLTWRNEVYPVKKQLIEQVLQTCVNATSQSRGRFPQNKEQQGTVVLHVDVSNMQKEYEDLITTFERLDGLLSLHNARIEVLIP